MKYNFSKNGTNLIITLDTESGKYAPEIVTVNDPNFTLENNNIWLYENGKFLRFFLFNQLGTIDGVIPTSTDDAYTKLNIIGNSLSLLEVAQVSTYALMLDIATSSRLKIIKVLNDENKGITNAIYHIYPDGVRMWIASNQDN